MGPTLAGHLAIPKQILGIPTPALPVGFYFPTCFLRLRLGSLQTASLRDASPPYVSLELPTLRYMVCR